MLKIKNPMLSMLAFMVILEVTLSVIFNVLTSTNVIPPGLRFYFFGLLFGAYVFLFITGYMMRNLYKHLISSPMKYKKDIYDKSKTAYDSAKRHYLSPYDKKYYFTTLGSCAIFMAMIYSVRLFVGPMPFKWTCALANFANFTGRLNNVYISISVFGVLLFATVFAAKIGVKSSKEKHAKERAEQYSKYKYQRDAQAEQATRAFRENEAEAKGVDLYDSGHWHKHQRREREDAEGQSRALRDEKREGVDVLGAVLKRSRPSTANGELERRSEELRREKREDVDVLGAVLKRSRSSKTNEELEKRSEELRREKREGIDVLGAVITKDHKRKENSKNIDTSQN